MNGMYNPHDRVQLDPGAGRTKQSFYEESNINLIMAKYEKTGLLDHVNTHEGNYGDFIAAPDYHTAMNQIRDAGEMFMAIPANTRSEFENDPARFLEFVQDEGNYDRMVEMGLAKARPNPPVVREDGEMRHPEPVQPATAPLDDATP